MDIQQLEKALSSLGYPVTFHHFDRPQELPFLVWMENNSSNVNSDLHIYRPVDSYQFDFYYSSWLQRKKLEADLTKIGYPWQRTETDSWIDSEKMYRSGYEIGDGL